MNQTIDLYQALKEMREAKTPFSVEFVTYSTTRQTGGEHVKMKNVLEAGQQANDNKNAMIAFREADKLDGKHRRCYIWSILKFNNKKIVW